MLFVLCSGVCIVDEIDRTVSAGCAMMKPPHALFGMAGHALVLCVFGALAAMAVAQPAPETWTPVSRMAQTITGRVTFTPSEMSFQGGKSLTLTPGGQMLFRPEPKQKKVMADLYRVTPPDDPTLENGNKLCKGKPVAFLLVWKSEKIGNEADPRTLAPFSGQKFTPGSPDDCGRYTYNAGKP
jgi:hypothetical protein